MIFGSSAVSCGQAGRAGTDPVWYYKRIERPGLLFRVFVRGGCCVCAGCRENYRCSTEVDCAAGLRVGGG